MTNYQYEPLPVPPQWGREERLFLSRLNDVLDDIYLKWGRISEKDLSGSLRGKIEGKADAAQLADYSSLEQTRSAIQAAVGQIRVGGRNLLLGTADPISRAEDGDIGEYALGTETGRLTGPQAHLSFDRNAASDCAVSVHIGDSALATFSISAGAGHESRNVVLPAALPVDGGVRFSVLGLTGGIEISHVQLELGNMETDWGQADGELVAGSQVSISRDGVRIGTQTFQVGCGGDEYMALDASGGYFPRLVSPQTAPRYDGPTALYVNGENDADGRTYFGSLWDALEQVNGKWLDADVSITVCAAYAEYGKLELRGICGGGSLTLNCGNLTAYEPVCAANCAAPVTVSALKVKSTGSPLAIRACTYVVADDCTLEATESTAVVTVADGATARLTNTVMAAGNFALRAWNGSRVTVYNCTGDKNLCSQAAFVIGAGTLPSASASSVTTTAYQNGYIHVSGTVSRGSGAGTIAGTSVSGEGETRVLPASTANYQTVWSGIGGDLSQGVTPPYGAITGCMWFDLSALSGSAAGAKLRLTRVSGYGQSGEVEVRLAGLAPGCTAGGTAPMRKYAYGLVGRIAPGQTKTFTLPASAANDLLTGRASALALYAVDTAAQSGLGYSVNYARFYGASGSDSVKPALTIIQ